MTQMVASQSWALEVRQDLAVKADGFMDVCKVLGQFSDLASSLKAGV